MSRAPERITYDGDRLDEVVVYGATVHIEGLSWHTYMVLLELANGHWLHLQATDVWVMENDSKVPVTKGKPLSYLCPVKSGDKRHQCERAGHHTVHRCECGRVLCMPNPKATP